MSEISSWQPTSEQLAAFRACDPVAIGDVIDLVLPQLVRWARARFPSLPLEDVQDVVHQVLAEISVHPERYDPSRAAFTTYAFELIKLRLTDVYARWKKIEDHEESGPEVHEKLLLLPYNESSEHDVDVLLTRDDFFRHVEQYLTDAERDICRIMRESDDPQAIADVLARYGDNSEVKNARAKLRRKLASIAARSSFDAEDVL